MHYLDADLENSDCNLLSVHGYLGSTVSFLDLVEILSADIRVVMPDLPPCGGSEVPDCACTMAYYLDFLTRFVEVVGFDSFHLMGTSVGATIAAHYTVEHPQQVEGLIFLSPFGLYDQAGRMSQIKLWDALLPQIEQSVLILIGSEDKLLCADDREKLRQLLTEGQLKIIEESGHFLYLDSPDVVSKKIVTYTRGGKQ
jgi:pimeloyl-ACP methyl ester carboxylesterase